MPKKPLPTKERLRHLFTYDHLSGLLINKARRTGSTVGKPAGSVSTAGYLQVSVDKKLYSAHRLIWVYLYGAIPDGYEIDHIDHEKLNNRQSNLRLVTPVENQHNKSPNRRSTSGFCGVHKAGYGRWAATIGHKGRQIHLGNFLSLDEAVGARRNAETLYGYHSNHGLR